MRDIRREIQDKLHDIEEQEQVRVLYAAESGSRAWGTASADSDYDVRFIYVRKKEDYLRLQELRDVIEWQLDETLDINGWDLKKALVQFHRGNATLFEWAASPVVYWNTDSWSRIRETAETCFSEKAALYHYYGTARSTYEEFLTGETVKYKKYVYALRPILACRYIEEYHRIPPVSFAELVQSELPGELKPAVAGMLAVKEVTGEKDCRPQIPAIRTYITAELTRLQETAKNKTDDREADWEALNRVFRMEIGE